MDHHHGGGMDFGGGHHGGGMDFGLGHQGGGMHLEEGFMEHHHDTNFHHHPHMLHSSFVEPTPRRFGYGGHAFGGYGYGGYRRRASGPVVYSDCCTIL